MQDKTELPVANDLTPYFSMFENYPDVVNVVQMCEMLGDINTKTGYKLLQANQINHFKIGKSYKIPKASIITYLINMMNKQSPQHFDALVH
jgi:hypothetical protein